SATTTASACCAPPTWPRRSAAGSACSGRSSGPSTPTTCSTRANSACNQCERGRGTMADTSGRRTRAANIARLREALQRSPVAASVVGAEPVPALNAAASQVAIVAPVELKDLAGVVAALLDGGKFFFLNVDSC